MIVKKNSIYLAVFALFVINTVAMAQLKVGGTDGPLGTKGKPHPSAMMDVESTDKGVLLPRITLTQTTVAAPVSNPAHTLTVFNIGASDSSVPEGERVTPGYYYWDQPPGETTGNWVRLSTAGIPALTQDLQAGLLSFDDGTGGASVQRQIHWKLDENGTGLATYNNVASGNYSTVMGGGVNVIGNPVPNNATGSHSVVAGGYSNLAIGAASVIAGGGSNRTEEQFTTVSGGNANQATATNATVGGGHSNTASAGHSTVAGGAGNKAAGSHSAISGGADNQAVGSHSVVAGGTNNQALGDYAVVSGGANNTAHSAYEWVHGRFGTVYVPQGTGSTPWHASDRLLSVANGNSLVSRSDAFTILKSGLTGIGFNNFENTTFSERLQVNGNARVSGLPDNNGNATTDRIVVADQNGVLKTIAPMDNSVSMPRFFYMPSIIVPLQQNQLTDGLAGESFSDATRTGVLDLHARYALQFGTPMVSTKPGTGNKLPVLPEDELYYHISWYDATVMETVTVNDKGVMTYTVRAGANVTMGSFMNIVFEVR